LTRPGARCTILIGNIGGRINAASQILVGTGLSLSLERNGSEQTLKIALDPVEAEDSGLGLKLNIVSIPKDGLVVEYPGGCTTEVSQDGADIILKWKGFTLD
jgi:hypothetical protein